VIDLEQLIADAVARELDRRGIKAANDSSYLNVAEAASLARVSPGTIRRWVRAGELTRHEAGTRVLVRRDELERLLRCEVVPIDKNLSPEERARRRFG